MLRTGVGTPRRAPGDEHGVLGLLVGKDTARPEHMPRYALLMTADISDLQGHIEEFIVRVRGGETVFVTDREKVIAKLEPATEAQLDEENQAWIDDLVRRGVATSPIEQMTPEENERLLAEVLNSPPLPDIVAAVLKEREEGW